MKLIFVSRLKWSAFPSVLGSHPIQRMPECSKRLSKKEFFLLAYSPRPGTLVSPAFGRRLGLKRVLLPLLILRPSDSVWGCTTGILILRPADYRSWDFSGSYNKSLCI